MFNSKKAVSPIIAAVLLVVITIAIGATTMAFIRSLADTNLETAEQQSTKISCGADLDLEIPVVNDEYKICYNETSGDIDATLHNTGSVNVKSFDFTAIWTNGSITTTTETGSAINKNTYKVMTFTLTGVPGNATTNISQYRIDPRIQGAPGKGDTICSDVAIVRDVPDDIDICT